MDLRPLQHDRAAANSAVAGCSDDVIFDVPGIESNTVDKLLQAGCKLYLMYALESSNKLMRLLHVLYCHNFTLNQHAQLHK